MSSIEEIPEIKCLGSLDSVIRIPDEIDVPITPRIRKLIDTPEFRRLARISQLGLVSLVYPAANHTRFEHSLGVYRTALLYVRQLSKFPRFHELVTVEDVEVFIVASLLHDLGHWPFCHPIEDLELPGVPEHELFANSFLLEGDVANTLRDEWGINPRDIVTMLSGKARSKSGELLKSMLSGPIDVDKLDYLQRDSLHAGVPYGKNFDQQRLIGSLCINQSGNRVAITQKGKTAAEMMVFSRYVMFSEVYWHHAVRSATTMLQRLFYLVYKSVDLDLLFRMHESEFIDRLRLEAQKHSIGDLANGLFGPSRDLYKRFFEVSFLDQPELYNALAHQDYSLLVSCADRLSGAISRAVGFRVAPYQVIVDAPPKSHESQFEVDVFSAASNKSRPLELVSPIVKAMNSQRFDSLVKRIRVFLHPDISKRLPGQIDKAALLRSCLPS